MTNILGEYLVFLRPVFVVPLKDDVNAVRTVFNVNDGAYHAAAACGYPVTGVKFSHNGHGKRSLNSSPKTWAWRR